MKLENNNIDILHNTEKKILMFGNEPVLNMNIDNFRVASDKRFFDRLVNSNLSKQQVQFLKKVHTELYPNAVKDFTNSKINNFFFAPYEAYLVYTVAMNQLCVLSFYYDEYIFSGGAHGTTLRQSQSYSYKNNRQLYLWDFFRSKVYAREVILNEILLQAEAEMEKNSNIYFENYKTLIKKNFNPNNFYLTPKGIVLYYNQYEIAPYVSGIVEFLIPYSMVDFPPKC